jgi:hypothetical protein
LSAVVVGIPGWTTIGEISTVGMEYLSQFLTFVLAVSGILFKTTATDIAGNPRKTRSGLPVLTLAGIGVLGLLVLSLLSSLYTTYSKTSSSDSQNRDLQTRLAVLQKQNAALTEQIEKRSEPFGEVFLSFSAEIPQAHPALQAFRARLLQATQDYNHLKRRFNPPDEEVDPTGMSFDLILREPSRLLPNRVGDQAAYELINAWQLSVYIYKKPRTIAELNAQNLPADAEFLAGAAIHRDSGVPPWFSDRLAVQWDMDVTTKPIYLVAMDVPVSADNQFRNVAIRTVDDLQESQVVVLLSPPAGPRSMLQDGRSTKGVTLKQLKLRLASGRVFLLEKLERHENANPSRLPFYTAILPRLP